MSHQVGRLPWVYPALCVLGILAFGLLSEKIPINEGLGYHADSWATRLRDLSDLLQGKASLNDLQHILPTLLIGLLFKAVHFVPNNKEIVATCAVFYTVCYAAIIYFWRALCAHLDIDARGELLGLCALVLNGTLKNNFFYPTMVYDGFFYALSMAMVYFWHRKNTLAQFGVILAALLTHQMALMTYAVLFAFPAQETPADQARPRRSARADLWLTAALVLATVLVMTQADLHVFRYMNYRKLTGNPFMALSIFIAGCYLALAFYPIVRRGPVALALRAVTANTALRLGAVGVAYVAVNLLLKRLAAPGEQLFTLAEALVYFVWLPAFDAPGLFLITKLTNFGPLVILLAWRWRQAADLAARLGPGGLLTLIVIVYRCFDTEFRHLPDAWAFMVPLAVLACQDMLDQNRMLFFVFISCLLSKVWMPYGLNHPDWYFWNYGSFTSTETGYAIQLLAAVLCLLFFLIVFRFPPETDRKTAAMHTGDAV